MKMTGTPYEPEVGNPEPIPSWNGSDGSLVWKYALPVHSYIFGIIFFAVAVYGVYNLARLCQRQLGSYKNYFICITLLVSLFGLTRSIVLLADPYLIGKPFHLAPASGLLLFSLGFPCLTSGFFLINWSLVEVTKMQFIPPCINKRKVLALVLLLHFTVVISLDMTFAFNPRSYIYLFICRLFFVLWGIMLFGGFMIASIRIQRQVKKNIRGLSRNNDAPVHISSPNNNRSHVVTTIGITSDVSARRLQQTRTKKVMKIVCSAAATGLLICCSQIYSLWEFYVFHHDNVMPNPWPWWIYQTCFRLVELFMAGQMFLIIRPKQ